MPPEVPDIRDIKPPVEMPAFLWWILIIVVVSAVAWLVYFLYRRRPAPVMRPVQVPARSSWETALEHLENLHHKHYPEAGLFKQFYSGLSDIVRRYLEDRFAIRAPEMTTEEFLNYAKTSAALNDGQKELLKDFLNRSDMVKFARYVPAVHDAQANFDSAKKLILETKNGI